MLLRLVLIALLHSWSYPATAVVNATDTYIRHPRRKRVLRRGVIPLNRRRIEEAKKASNDNFPLIFIIGASDGLETMPADVPDTITESRGVEGLGVTNEPSKSSTPWPSINDAISTPWPSINDGISSPWPLINDVSPASRKPLPTPTSSPTTEEPSSDAPTPYPSDSPTSDSPTSNEPTFIPTTMQPTLKQTTTPTTAAPSDSPTSDSPTSNEPTLITTTTLISRSITTGPTLKPNVEVIPTYYPTYSSSTGMPSEGPVTGSPVTDLPTRTPIEQFSQSMSMFEMSIHTVESPISLSMKMINLSVPKELYEVSMSISLVQILDLHDIYTENMSIKYLEPSMPVVDVSLSIKLISLPLSVSMSMAVVEMPLSLELHDIYREITDSFSMSLSVLELSTPFVDDESLSMGAIKIPFELNDRNKIDFHGEIISEPTINPTNRPSPQWTTYETTSSPIKASANPSNRQFSRLSGNPSFDSSLGPSIPLNELSFTTATMLPSKSLTENLLTNSPSVTSLVPTFGGTYSTISAKIATYSPTRTPSTAPAANAEANVQLELKGVDSEMDDEATLVFRQSCSLFVEGFLLDTKTSALTIECKITNQHLSSEGRRLSGDERGSLGVVRSLRTEPSLLVDVTIEGETIKGQINFSTEVIDAFASQSSKFTKQLKEDGNKAGIKYFDDLTSTLVDSIDGDSAANEIVTSTGDLNSRESTKTTSSNGTYIVIIATACLTSIVLAVFAYMTITTRKKTLHGELVEEDNETASNILNDLGALEVGCMLSPKYIQHQPRSLEDSVLDIILCKGPVYQTIEIVTPQGKLGIVVTTHIEGPVVYSIKNESPLQGLIFVDDLIAAIDSEDTRGWTAQSFVKIVAKKNGAPCKLTVLRPTANNN